jgi:hypothetical protein
MKIEVKPLAIVAVLLVGLAVAQTDIFGLSRMGTLDQVQAAIEAGADVNAINAEGDSPFLIAVRHNTPEVVRALIQAGADINFVNALTGEGPYVYVRKSPHGDAMYQVLNDAGVVAHVRGGGTRSQTPSAAAPPPPLAPVERDLDGFTRDPMYASVTIDMIDKWATHRIQMDGEPLTAHNYTTLCKSLVYRDLKAPSTASFVNDAGPPTVDPLGVMIYTFDVDAQNSFGAYIRENYQCSGYLRQGLLTLTIM